MLGVALARVSTQLKSALQREAGRYAERAVGSGAAGVSTSAARGRQRENVVYQPAVYGFA